MAFSSSLLLADLDYIAPSQACIKPVLVKDEGGGVHRHVPGEAPNPEDIVKISLQDCLACSGCVTSAETMLVERQSKEEILNTIKAAPEKRVVVSISDQSASSIAVQLGVGMQEGFEAIAGFARDVLGATAVVDLRWAQRASLHETAVEFVDRLQNRPEQLPLIVSSCPGWVCYCEKTHPQLIPYLCPIKSAQAIAGEYLKAANGSGENTIHLSVQPCFDKKLEAVREEYVDEESGVPHTDFVLSSQEMLEWMTETDAAPLNRWKSPLDSAPDALRGPSMDCEAVHLEGSGGFHQYAMQYAAQVLSCSSVPLEALTYTTKRNANHKILNFEFPGGARKEVCVAYGFQHIQNIVRGINRKLATVAKYCFIELMACPDGCLNGGGQVRTKRHNETLQAVNAVFEGYVAELAARASSPGSAEDQPVKASRGEDRGEAQHNKAFGKRLHSPKDEVSYDALYQEFVGDAPGSDKARSKLSCKFVDRKAAMAEIQKDQPIVAQSLKW